MTNVNKLLIHSRRTQIVLGQFGAGALVCILAIVPVVLAWRSPDPNLMIAAVAFDVILLPVIVALIVMVFVPPMPIRDRVIAGLCSAPILLWISSILLFPILFVWEAFHPVSWASVLKLLMALQFVALLYFGVRSYVRCRCPRCAGRRFDVEYRYDPVKRASLPTGLHLCRNCHQRIRYVFMGFGRSRIEPVDCEMATKFAIQAERPP